MEVDIDLSALEIQDRKRNHNELDSPTNSLELGSKESEPLRRSGRKKVRPLEIQEKRRVLTRPRKLNINSTMKEIENYYLDKKVKVSSPALETIFEEPKKDILMGTRRLRRCINFGDVANEKPDKAKVKKRSMKAKKISTFKKMGKKIGLEFLMTKLKKLETDEQEAFTC